MLVLSVFSVVFLALVVGSYRLESTTMDEPVHLLAGYTALRLRDYRVDPEHPPFLRMWAALPLLAMPEINLDTNRVDWRKDNQWSFSHQFLYEDNDADHLLYRARFMIALLGVLLGILVFCWARELFGFWPAVIALGFYCVEPNLVAHSGLVTTDLGATCFIFGTVYFAWRSSRNFGFGNLLGLATFFALAHISKYSAVLLGPIVFLLLLSRALSGAPWPCRLVPQKLITSRRRKALLVVLTTVGLLATAYGALWGAYAFRYAPTPRGAGRFVTAEKAKDLFPRAARLVRWVEDYRLLPNTCVQGFAIMTTGTQSKMGYLLGQRSVKGWWYYFPVALLVKTPLALLTLSIAGLMLCVARWKTAPLDLAFILGPPAVYFGIAMAGHLNIGLRHVLSIYPFVLLLAGSAIAVLSTATRPAKRRRRLVLAVLCLAQLVEFGAVYPHCLAFFNASIGGPRQGAKYLVDSNLDWGQGLKQLGRWMVDHHVRHINLSYFGNSDPAYYGIDYTPLPSSPFSDLELIPRPRLPGYVAVSATNLRGAYMFERHFYEPLWERKPIAVLGYCIYIYWVEQPWW